MPSVDLEPAVGVGQYRLLIPTPADAVTGDRGVGASALGHALDVDERVGDRATAFVDDDSKEPTVEGFDGQRDLGDLVGDDLGELALAVVVAGPGLA